MLAALRGPWQGDWSISLRSYVTAAMLLVLMPLLGHAVLVTWYSYSASRHWAERDLMGDAEHLAEDVDSRLDVSRAVMQMVARSPAARRGDLDALRDHLVSARGAGLIRAAAVTDPQGAVLTEVGLGAGAAKGIAGPGASELPLAGRVDGEPVLVAAWPIGSDEPRVAWLEFAISVAVLRTMRGGEGDWPWHVTTVTDRNAQMVWSAEALMGTAVMRQVLDPAATAGVVHDWVAPDGTAHTIGYARTPRSGLTVVVAQPSPGLYQRVPLGPLGAVTIAVGVTLLSVMLARYGALRISDAYQAALRGTRASGLRIDDAVQLGVELRRSRDRLFHAVGGIAVVEMTRPPGKRWGEAEVVASGNIGALMGLAPGEALTAERLMLNLAPEDRQALGATLAEAPGQARVFTRLIRTAPGDRAPRYFNLVGMLGAGGPAAPAQLVLTLQDVTAQKETELELQAQASRLRLATEIAGLGVWERDPQRGTGHASERLWEIMGRTPDGKLDMPAFLETVHPDDRERVAQAIRVRLPEEAGGAEGRPSQLRYRILRPDGTVRHVRSSRVFVDDPAGGETRVVGVLIDETEAVMAQRALAASEARFRLAVDVAELGVFERYIDRHRNVGVWNERMWRMRGLEPRPEPMAYDEMVAMVHPEDRVRIQALMLERRTRGDGSSDYEFRITRADGEERIIQSRSVRTHHPEDGAISIVAINLDVTERRRAEQALREAAARFELAVETAELGFAQRDPASGKGLWSDRLMRIFGLPPGGEPPSREGMLALVHPDDRAAVRASLAGQETGAEGQVSEIEFRILRPDGQERCVHARGQRLRRPDGSELLSTVVQDVTERRRAEQALQEGTARLQLAVETAQLGFAQLDPATGQGLWSERLYQIYGLAPRAARPSLEEVLERVHPEDRPIMLADLARQRAAPDGRPVDSAFRIARPDGEERFLHVRSVRMRRRDGSETLFTITQDMTEQRRAAQAIARSEARFRLAAETAELGVAELNVATGAGVWNERLYQICGLEPQARRPAMAEVLALVHPEDRPGVEETLAAQRASGPGVVTEFDFRIRRPDGAERVLHVRSTLVSAPDGQDILLTVTQDITRQRLAERELAESEARFRLAVDTAELGVSDRNLTTGEGTWSERMFRILGMEPDARPLGREATLASVHPEDRALIDGVRDRHAAAGDGFVSEYEFRMLRADGEARILHARSVTLRSPDGGVRLLSVNQDVTERRQAQQALADSELRLRLAVDAAGLGIWDYDKRADRTVWSDRMWRIRGLEPRSDGPTREQILEAVVEEDRPGLLRFWDRIEAGEEDISYEYRVRWPNGVVRHISGLGRLVRDAGGEVVRVVGVSSDITVRRMAERQIAESELRLRLATDVTGLGIWDHDPATGTTVWNDQMFRLRGLEPASQVPDLAFIAEHTVEQDRATLLDAWNSLKENKTSLGFEYRAVWPDGTVRWLRSEGRSLQDAQGRVVRMLGVVMDVTAQREAEIALLDRNTTLELAIEAADLGIWTREPGATARIASARLWAMLGHPGRDGAMTRDELLACLHPDDRAAVLREWVPADGAPSPRQREFRAIWPDGTVRHFQSRRAVMRDAGGKTLRVIGMVADVTEARRAAAALAASETRLRLAVEAAEMGVFEYDPATREGHWSDATWRMRGMEPRPGIPTLAEVAASIHPEDREAAVAKARRQFTGVDGTRLDDEYRVVLPDGTVRHLMLRAVLHRWADGTARVFGINMDVTERRMAAQALEASEARLRLAVETAGLGVFEHDPATRVSYWSDRIWQMRGLEPRETAPSFDEGMAMVHPDDRARLVAHIRQLEALADGDIASVEYRVVWPNGSVRHLVARTMTLRTRDRAGIRFYGINQDVTESLLAAQALEASEARLRLAVDAAEMGVFEFDPESRTGYWSERIWRMRGLEPRPGTLSFQEVIDLVHPADREVVAARMREQFEAADGKRGDHEFRIVRPDGAVRYIHSRAITQRRSDGGLHRLFGINIDITERRLAAKALEESEARLRLASEAAGLGVFQVNSPEGTGYWSDRMWRIRGLAPQEGLPGSEAAVSTVHPDDRDIVRGLRRNAATWPAGVPVRQQFRVIWPDGTLRHVASHALVMRTQEDGAFSLIGVNADITEQVEREQALREAAARFELAIDAAELAVWDWDPATDQMTWSHRIWDMMGLEPRDEVPRLEMRQKGVHPADRDRVPMVWIRSVMEGNEGRGEDEFRIVRRDGSIGYVHWQGIPLRDQDGRIVRLAGVAADVTEARLSELALRTSEELFRMAAEASEQGVWNHDLATGALTWSARLWRIHGLPPQDGAPAPEDRAALIHPEDRLEVLGLMDELRGAPPNTVARRSYRILRADGAVRTVERQAMLLMGADGAPARIVGVVHDVTEARELAAQTMVADKLATLGEMAGAIAHELAQPLQAVMATAATARVRLTNGSDQDTLTRVCDRLAWIERQTSRAGKTIQHLLAFSRGESAEGFCRLGDALEGAMELAGHGLRRDRVEVQLDLPPDLPPVRGGQIAIEQVLVNLLNNARDAMAERQPRRIGIAARLEGDSVVLDITDTGGGVAPDKMERIFEPFYTTKPVGRGTGIGLSVARRTMLSLGGGISVANTGSGACFTLTFRNAAAGA